MCVAEKQEVKMASQQFCWKRALVMSEHVILTSIGLASLNILWNEGFHGLAKTLIRFFRTLPGVNSIIGLILDGEVKGAVKLLAKGSEKSSTTPALIPIPVKGVPPDQIIELLHRIHATENTAENGKSFAYTYTTVTDMEQFSKALAMAYNTFSGKLIPRCCTDYSRVQ